VPVYNISAAKGIGIYLVNARESKIYLEGKAIFAVHIGLKNF
jgi:hypothetical protein